MSLSNIRFAISSDFLGAFANIPKNKQKKVSEFITKFQNNPTSSGINYESIKHVNDGNMKSVRIDKEYRGIVYKPSDGNVYLLLWVDLHDRAYDWACRRKCTVNARTGTVQVFEVTKEVLLSGLAERKEKEILGPFSSVSKNDLLRMGLPEDLVPLVHSLRDKLELEKNRALIPHESYEALEFILAGLSPDEVINELFMDEVSSDLDADDFHKALDNPGSKQQFFVVDQDNESELMDMLNAPLDKWRVFLHRSQRKIVERDFSGPARVLGGAGTGKTVVAMHRARYLAKNVFTRPSDKILFTTFSTNLAEDIKSNLRKICSSEVMKKIEVVNIDRWVNEYMRECEYEYSLTYGDAINGIWNSAFASTDVGLEHSVDFYKDEWEHVITANDIYTLNDYLGCSRVGRGIPAGRKERKKIWAVIDEFKRGMDQAGLRDIHWLLMDARVVIKNRGTPVDYRAVVVDEAQDLSPQAFRLLRDLMGEEKRNHIFIVGDAHQRIYGHRLSLKKCGVNIQGRSKILRINYRTTEETRNWAFSILKDCEIDDLNGGKDTGKGYRSLFKGPKPQVHCFKDFNEEVAFVYDRIKELVDRGVDVRDICIVFRTNRIMKDFSKLLREKGLDSYKISNSEADNRTIEFVRVATMHRVKGLEFEHVFIACANYGVIPLEYVFNDGDDAVLREEKELSERSLLYVASTRAKNTLTVTAYGKLSPYIHEMDG